MKEFKKVTVGFVVQNYATLNGKYICVGQEFVAGEQVDYENENGEPVEIDTAKEAYFPFEMAAPKQVVTGGLKFICPSCGCNYLEQILDGVHSIQILNIDEDSDFNYGEYESDGMVDRVQCVGCGYILKDKFDSEITENMEIVEWVKNNCK